MGTILIKLGQKIVHISQQESGQQAGTTYCHSVIPSKIAESVISNTKNIKTPSYKKLR